MTYAILLNIVKTDIEIRLDIKGTESLEKFTDNRICGIYKKGKQVSITVGNASFDAIVKSVIKVYPYSCKVLN